MDMIVGCRRIVVFTSLSLRHRAKIGWSNVSNERDRSLTVAALLGIALFAQQMAPAGQYPGSLLAGLRWRDVGPMRGGRSYAVAGHADQPDTFYMGSVGGGVWETEKSRSE